MSKKKKMPKYIVKDIEISSDESDEVDSEEENSDVKSSGENSDKENNVKECINSTVFKHLF